MSFARVLCLLAAVIFVSAPAPSEIMLSPEESLSYRCARDVATIVGHGQQTGPIFSEDDLVFASVVARDGSAMLMVNDGSGTYVVRLAHQGVNRIRFAIPRPSAPRTYFISYAHDDVFRSRLFEYAVGRAPTGRDELDFVPTELARAPAYLPNFEYAILQTSESALAAITEGKIARTDLNRHRVKDCEHLTKRAPVLARGLKHNLDMLELIVVGPAPTATGRLPASVR